MMNFYVVFLLFLAIVSPPTHAHSCRDQLLESGEQREVGHQEDPKAHAHQDLTQLVSGMEKSSMQKAAFAGLARPGRIVDLGSGSGISAYDLARFFPDSQVFGLDLDPAMVKYARSHYSAPNLSFQTGNAELKNFAESFLSAIFMSSTAHHLTSYGTGDFDVQHVRRATRSAYDQLKVGGLFILRDFLLAEGPQDVLLELPQDDGLLVGDEIERMSSAELFKRFSVDFRSSQHPHSGVVVEDRGELADGWHQFRVSYRDAVEFILRKDYRNTYAAEIKEEYTFMNQSQYEDMFRNAGFRVLHSSPIYNAWIIENRFQGKVRIKGLDGREMPFPATNYVIVGEKIPNNWGVRIVEQSSTVLQESRFLTRKAMKDRRSGQIFDLVGRPHQTIDLLPYFKRKGKIFVLGKQGFPRPIITSLGDDQHLDGIRNDGYMVEPISFIWDGRSPRFESIERELEKRAGVSKGEILQRGSSQSYEFFVSPGLVAEKVTSLALGVKSRSGNFIDVPNYTDLSSAGSIRPIDAQQVLRSAQAGSVLDARMEIATYNLMLDSRVALGPWIGSEIQLVESPRSPHILDSIVNLLNPKQRRRVFVAEDSPSFGSYLEIKRGSYLEQDGRGNILNRVEREYVVPREMSSSVVSILPVLKSKGKIYVGLEKRHLPGVQANEGFSDIVVNPAWRIPKSIKDMDSAKKFVKDRLFQDMGVVGSRIFSLGGPYHPSPGISPEVVHSFAVEIIFDRQMKPSELKALSWVALDELLEHRSLIRDAHLFVASLRLAHALGVIK